MAVVPSDELIGARASPARSSFDALVTMPPALELSVPAKPKRKATRKAKPKSPTAKTLAHLRGLGYPLVQVVEHWNPHARIRQDLFGIIDVLAVCDSDIVAVQATSRDNVSGRVAKMAESDALPVLLKAGIRVIVHGWGKNSKGKWILREVEF
jgi:hypothetical protein